MTLQVQISVPNLGPLAQKLTPENFEKGLRVGLTKAGGQVALHARAIIKPHHFTGHYEQQIHTEVTGSGFDLKATVGVSRAQVPEAAPLSYGWKSETGKQPPTDAIARWLVRKPGIGSSVSSNITTNAAGQRRTIGTIGSVASESKVRGLAFVIARNIKRRGYSSKTPPLRVWERAYQEVSGQIGAIIHSSLAWRA